MSVTTIPIPRRHARLARYALWQAGDFVMNIGIITVILFALLGVTVIMNIHAQEAWMITQHRTMSDAAKTGGFRDIFGMYAIVGPIIALSNVISGDRSAGHTRFLFAKPLSPRRFYVQSLLVRFAGFLVVGHLLVLAWGLFEPPGYTVKFIADLSIAFVAVGGIVVLFSAVSRYDGLLVIVLLLLGSIFWDNWEKASGIRHAVIYAFPPIGKTGEIHAWLLGLSQLGNFAPMPFPTKWALWLTGYGLACAALGLYLLRRIPLTKA